MSDTMSLKEFVEKVNDLVHRCGENSVEPLTCVPGLLPETPFFIGHLYRHTNVARWQIGSLCFESAVNTEKRSERYGVFATWNEEVQLQIDFENGAVSAYSSEHEIRAILCENESHFAGWLLFFLQSYLSLVNGYQLNGFDPVAQYRLLALQVQQRYLINKLLSTNTILEKIQRLMPEEVNKIETTDYKP